MNHMFSGVTTFNQDISGWDVSKVKYMKYMFAKTGADQMTFNQDISAWDVSSVVSFDNMFTSNILGRELGGAAWVNSMAPTNWQNSQWSIAEGVSCASTEYESGGVCHARRVCGAGIEQAGDATTDDTCAACASGQYALQESDACTLQNKCPAGKKGLNPTSTTQANTCEDCVAGQFQALADFDGTECAAWTECPPGQFESATASNPAPSASHNRVCTDDVGLFSGAFSVVEDRKADRLKMAYALGGKDNAARKKIAEGDFTALVDAEIKSVLAQVSEFEFTTTEGMGYLKPNVAPTETTGYTLSASSRQFRKVEAGQTLFVYKEGVLLSYTFSSRRRLTAEDCANTPISCEGAEGEVCEVVYSAPAGCMEGAPCPLHHYCPSFNTSVKCPPNSENTDVGAVGVDSCTPCDGASLPGTACGACVPEGTWVCEGGKYVRDCVSLSVEMQMAGCCTGVCGVDTTGCC